MSRIQGRTIWDESCITDRTKTRIEDPCLVRFRDWWYCAVKESPSHNPHPLSRGRIIRSRDGERWESVRTLEWDGGSMAAGLCVTAEGALMASTGVYFVSKEPRADLSGWKKGDAPLKQPPARRPGDDPNAMLTTGFRYYQLEPIGTTLNLAPDDLELNVAHQFMTWLSPDGEHWSSAHACPNMINTQPFRITWHNGMGYVIGQWGKEPNGDTLYRTRDGRGWRALKPGLLPEGHGGEGALAFAPDGTAWCLLRGDSTTQAFIGRGKAPYYQDWEWKRPLADYGPKHGGMQPVEKVLRYGLAGPSLARLSDGRWLGMGRAMGPERDDGYATLFLVDPERAKLTMVAEFDGSSYPSFVEHDGMIWAAFIGSAWQRDVWEVRLAGIPLPDKRS